MGPKQSTQIKQCVEVLNKNVTNIMSKTSQTSGQDVSAVNSYKIRITPTGEFNCKKVNMSQKIQMDAKTKSMLQLKDSNDLMNVMKSAVDQAAKSSSEQVNGFLSATFGKQDTNVDISAKLQNIVETNISKESINSCMQTIKALNNEELLIEGKYNCDEQISSQDIAMNVVSECITNSITDTLMKNEQIAKAVQDAETKSKQENKGVDSIVDSFTGIFKNWTYIIAGFIGLIVFIVIIIVILKILKSDNSSNIQDSLEDNQDEDI
jgi:hypothetical protein